MCVAPNSSLFIEPSFLSLTLFPLFFGGEGGGICEMLISRSRFDLGSPAGSLSGMRESYSVYRVAMAAHGANC